MMQADSEKYAVAYKLYAIVDRRVDCSQQAHNRENFVENDSNCDGRLLRLGCTTLKSVRVTRM